MDQSALTRDGSEVSDGCDIFPRFFWLELVHFWAAYPVDGLGYVDRDGGLRSQIFLLPATATGTCSACCLEQGRCIFYKLFIPTGYFGSLDLAFLGRPFGAVILGKGFWL